jgi:hypothetical protein
MPPSAWHDLAPSGAIDVDAITVAMAIAPGVYSRNRFFELFKHPEVRRARRRASLVRGIVQHLCVLHRTRADGAQAVTFEDHAGRVRLRYGVPQLCFERRVDLSALEASCVLHLAERAGLLGLAPTGVDRDNLRGALRRLDGGEAALLLR